MVMECFARKAEASAGVVGAIVVVDLGAGEAAFEGANEDSAHVEGPEEVSPFLRLFFSFFSFLDLEGRASAA
jgi:hypothetical protein